MPELKLIVVTGLSGAGRSTALRMLEDVGFYCVDNLPPQLIPSLLQLLKESGQIQRVGLGVDLRSGSFLAGASEALDGLKACGWPTEVLFLDAVDEALVRRFSETRRPHRLAADGDVPGAIRRERAQLAPLRERATKIVDTTGTNVHQLRRLLVDIVSEGDAKVSMVARLVSFGFKYGVPADVDLLFDVRYLPNPYFVSDLREHSGLDTSVRDYVLGQDPTVELLGELEALLNRMLPRYGAEGKSYLTVGIGCTGGRHRSVAIAEELARRLSGTRTAVSHRDVQRGGAK